MKQSKAVNLHIWGAAIRKYLTITIYLFFYEGSQTSLHIIAVLVQGSSSCCTSSSSPCHAICIYQAWIISINYNTHVSMNEAVNQQNHIYLYYQSRGHCRSLWFLRLLLLSGNKTWAKRRAQIWLVWCGSMWLECDSLNCGKVQEVQKQVDSAGIVSHKGCIHTLH